MPVMASPLPRPLYVWTLTRLYGLYAPLDAALSRAPLPSAVAFGQRRKLDALRADLQVFGVQPEAAPLAPAPDLPGAAHALGALYVLEGATLGGQVIARHLARQLGIDAASGAAFFHSYGAQVGPMWRAFGAALEEYVSVHGGHAEVLEGAARTFGAFEAWLGEEVPA